MQMAHNPEDQKKWTNKSYTLMDEVYGELRNTPSNYDVGHSPHGHKPW